MEKKDKIIEELLKRVQENNPDTLNYAIPNLFTKKLKSYMLIREDLKHILYLTEKLVEFKNIDNPDEQINSGLWYSIIIIYGKCFTSNNAGMSKLENDLFNESTVPLMETSEKLLDLRNSFVAHRDDTEKEQALVFMKLSKDEDFSEDTEYQISSAKLLSPSIDELNRYTELFTYLIGVVENKIQKQAQKVHESFLSHISPQQANFLLINNMKKSS